MICPNCAHNEFLDEGNNSYTCANCGAVQGSFLLLSREEAKLLSTHMLEPVTIPHHYYNELHPIVRKIVRFADTGNES